MPFAGEPAHDSPDTFALAVGHLEGSTWEQQTKPVVPSMVRTAVPSSVSGRDTVRELTDGAVEVDD